MTRRTWVARGIVASAALVLGGSALAQSSASFRLEEQVFNGGGVHPGVVMSSAGFQVKLDAIAGGVAGAPLTAGQFRLDVGFVAGLPAPGEVGDLRFVDRVTLAWSPEPSAGTYNLYRGDLANLGSARGLGSCLAPGLSATSGTDAETPTAMGGFFYLVTVENRLGEEGTKGFDGSGTERPDSGRCP